MCNGDAFVVAAVGGENVPGISLTISGAIREKDFCSYGLPYFSELAYASTISNTWCIFYHVYFDKSRQNSGKSSKRSTISTIGDLPRQLCLDGIYKKMTAKTTGQEEAGHLHRQTKEGVRPFCDRP
jgi:hypothetical protein